MRTVDANTALLVAIAASLDRIDRRQAGVEMAWLDTRPMKPSEVRAISDLPADPVVDMLGDVFKRLGQVAASTASAASPATPSLRWSRAARALSATASMVEWVARRLRLLAVRQAARAAKRAAAAAPESNTKALP